MNRIFQSAWAWPGADWGCDKLKNISILPPEIRLQRQAGVRRAKHLKQGGTVFLLLLVIYTGTGLATLHARSRVTDLQRQRALLGEKISGFREYVAMEDRINLLDSLVKKATGSSPDWAAALVSINNTLPPGVWLTEFNGVAASRSKKNETSKAGTTAAAKTSGSGPVSGQTSRSRETGDEIVIRGYTFNNQDLATWLQKLGSSGLADVRLQSAEREAAGNSSLINFEITAGLAPPKTDSGGGQ